MLHSNAKTFTYPDAPTVMFIFNSFDPPVLTAVIRSALASGRPFRVIYLKPVHSYDWIDEGWLLLKAGNGGQQSVSRAEQHGSCPAGRLIALVDAKPVIRCHC